MVCVAFYELRGRVGGPTAVASCSTLARAAPPSSLAHLQPCRQNTTIRSTSSVLQFFRLLTSYEPLWRFHCASFDHRSSQARRRSRYSSLGVRRMRTAPETYPENSALK